MTLFPYREKPVSYTHLENTEVGTRFLCLLRKFFLNPYYNGKPRFAKLTQKKNAAISKRLQRFLKPI